jgi:hypothetical protein
MVEKRWAWMIERFRILLGMASVGRTFGQTERIVTSARKTTAPGAFGVQV